MTDLRDAAEHAYRALAQLAASLRESGHLIEAATVEEAQDDCRAAVRFATRSPPPALAHAERRDRP